MLKVNKVIDEEKIKYEFFKNKNSVKILYISLEENLKKRISDIILNKKADLLCINNILYFTLKEDFKIGDIKNYLPIKIKGFRRKTKKSNSEDLFKK